MNGPGPAPVQPSYCLWWYDGTTVAASPSSVNCTNCGTMRPAVPTSSTTPGWIITPCLSFPTPGPLNFYCPTGYSVSGSPYPRLTKMVKPSKKPVTKLKKATSKSKAKMATSKTTKKPKKGTS
jgi:hypothetical protein